MARRNGFNATMYLSVLQEQTATPDKHARLLARIARMSVQVGDCREWQGTTNNDGYARMSFWWAKGRRQVKLLVHVVVWMLGAQRVPAAGFEIDHVCKVRCCIAGSHLDECAIPVNRNTVAQRWQRMRLPSQYATV